MLVPTVTFLLVSFLIGIHAITRIGGKVRNFYVAGNIIPFWVLALSMTGQAIELGGTQDNATFVMSDGFWAGAVLPIGIGISLLMIGFFYAKPLHEMRLLTLPDFYLKRFNRAVELLVSVLCVSSFIILLAGNFAGIGIILNFLLGIPPEQAITWVAIPVMLYTMAGGLFAVTWNDVLHVGVMIVGFGAALIWLIVQNDATVLDAAMTEKFSWDALNNFSSGGALKTWASLLALGLGDIVALDFMERVFAAKTPQSAKVACLISGAITIAVGVILAGIGMIASVTMKEVPEANAFLIFIQTALPHGIAMMVFLALLAAAISTCDGVIMACSVVITKNIVQSQFPKLIPTERLLLFSRLSAVPVTVLGILIAIIRPVPGDLLVLAFDVVFAGCLVPLTLGIYWEKTTSAAAFWSMLIASLSRIFLHMYLEHLNLPPQWAGLETLVPPVLSLIICVGMSLAQPAAVESKRVADAA